MSGQSEAELFRKRVAAIKQLLGEVSYEGVIEILTYLLGSVVAEAEPRQRPSLLRLIGRRISKAAKFQAMSGVSNRKQPDARYRRWARDS
jgi:hypothetical protein